MPATIKVDEERLEEQMKALSEALNNVISFKAPVEFSSMGDMASQSKYVVLAEKMEKLMTSYKKLMANSTMKAYSIAQGYKDTDKIMCENIVNASAAFCDTLQSGEK
ncbi:MAG: hypothetical protein E7257_10170 [Lachnospiraceae bacterium]|nr:hypothetical protein [Lachnospiraceae bacterium]